MTHRLWSAKRIERFFDKFFDIKNDTLFSSLKKKKCLIKELSPFDNNLTLLAIDFIEEPRYTDMAVYLL